MRLNIILGRCLTGLKYFRLRFSDLAVRIRARDRIKLIMTICMVRYKRSMSKKGRGIYGRDRNTLRNTLVYYNQLYCDNVEKRARDNVLKPFFL